MIEARSDGIMEYWNDGKLNIRRSFVRMVEYCTKGIPSEENWNIGKKFFPLFQYSTIPSFLCCTVLITAAFALSGCFTSGPEMMGSGYTNNGRENTLPIGNLETLWNERTTRLTPASEGSSGFSMLGGGGRGGMRGTFPLNASATLIDSTLMNSGLNEFASLADIKAKEKDLYITRYKELNKPDEYLFVWLELKTSYSKDLLKLDNWSIFLEDDKGNQFDPKNITEYPEKDLPKLNNLNRQKDFEKNNTWQMSAKVIQLYFPKKRFDGTPLISPDVKNIKLVMFNWSNNARYEGRWFTNPNDNSSLFSEKPDKL